MDINEAIRKAKESQKAIQRKEWREMNQAVIPTNSSYLGMFVVIENGKKGSRNWNPSAADLMADDWELF